MPYSNDGAFIEDDCRIFTYAHDMAKDTNCPTVIVPCVIDGEPNLYVSAYGAADNEDGQIFKDALNGTPDERCIAILSCCARAHAEAADIDRDPNHIARKQI